MYSMKELKTWWEVPAVAHFFSLFKSCFSLTDFTIEELEEALMVDGEDDKATTFTSRLLTELLQGCFDNPGISVTSYHDALISIMKTRWEEEDGRVNPLSSINADFHSLPTLLKVQIIHRLTEYRLDAKDVATKLSGLNPSDLRLEPLGADRNGSKYWYFFGVRLYKETPPNKKSKKRKHESKSKKSDLKRAKYPNLNNSNFDKLNSDKNEENDLNDIFERFTNNSFNEKHKKHKKKKQKKNKDEDLETSVLYGLSDGKWEVVCYNVEDWKLLARKLEDSGSRREDALCQLITDNFLPNLPKIVEDMEYQKLQKQFVETPRRSSCRLLAKKLYEEEEDGEMSLQHKEEVREEKEVKRRKEENERLSFGFERMLKVELERARKLAQLKWKKEQEEDRIKRLTEGISLKEDLASSSEEEEAVTPLPSTNRVNGIGMVAKTPLATSTKLTKPGDENRRQTENGSLNQNKKSNDSNKLKRKISNSKPKVEEKSKMEIGDFEYAAMWKAWESLDSNDEAWPFQNPVEEWYAPGYHNIIKRPIDLSTIEVKLKKTEYNNVSIFKDDITLMFNNCRLYNGPDSEYTEVANNLDKMFQKTLQSELSRKPSDNHKPTSTSKQSRKQTNNAVKPPEKGVAQPTTPKEPSPAPAISPEYLEDEEMEEEEENESESSSSDEFTPPGVSKAQMKKRKRELKKMKEQEKKKIASNRGRPKPAPPSRRSSTRKASSDVIDQSEEDESVSEEEASEAKSKTQSSTRAKKLVGRGRGNKITNARRNTKDSESSDDEKPAKHATKSRGRVNRRGRPAKGRGRGRRPSKAKTSNSESSSESEFEKDEIKPSTDQFNDAKNTKENENNDIEKTKQGSGDNELTRKLPKNADKQKSNIADKLKNSENKKKSFSRDRESSSSSSPASSRSHSLEKFEKLEEDAKSKPQVLWSLDFLASQARVLEEQHRRTESSSSSGKSTSEKHQSTNAFSNKSDSKNSEKNPDMDNNIQKLRIKQKPSPPVNNKSKSNPGSKEKDDIYSFHDDDDSPANMSDPKTKENLTSKQSSVSPLVSVAKSPLASPHNFYSPQNVSQNSKINSNTKLSDSKLRRSSVDPMSPPQTPSSGYSSSKTLSNSSTHYLSSSPYTDTNKGVDNKVQGKTNQQKSDAEQVNSPFAPQSQSGYQTTKTTSGSYTTQPASVSVASSPQSQAVQQRTPMVPTEAHGNISQRSYSLSSNAHNPVSNYSHSTTSNMEMSKNTASTTSNDNRYHIPLQHSASIPYTNSSTPQQQQPPHHVMDPKSSGHPVTNRRHSQPHLAQNQNMKLPDVPPSSYQHSKTNLGLDNNKNTDLNNSRLQEKITPSNIPQQQHSTISQNDISASMTHQHSHGSTYTPQSHPQSNLPNPLPHGHPARQNMQGRGGYDMLQRPVDNYNPSVSSSQQQYSYGKSTQATSNATPLVVASRENVTKYHHEALTQQQSRNSNNNLQQDPTMSTMSTNYEPTMATFGLQPWSLSQPGQAGNESRSNQGNVDQTASQRKSSSSMGYSVPKPNNNIQTHQQQQQQQAHPRLQQQQSYHSSSSSASSNNRKSHPPAPTPSPQQPNQSTGAHHHTVSNKTRNSSSNPATGGTPSAATSSKAHQRQTSTSSSQSNPSNAGMNAQSRRASGNTSHSQYQKSHSHYGYHIPPTPAPTPGGEPQTTGYSPHQQNGLLSATNNNAALLHQDLTASATLRALQQQHKTDHSSHAAASMFHYAAAVQQSQGVVAAANEKYNRLAAHHRGTPQGHPLAGVYHPHHQNAVTSTHQAAAHLSTPWLQAAAAAPTAGYPGNLLSHAAHMDPVYQHLMQQSGMHGQYPMYPNHVMQQLHQQHLQHHMLPKY